MAEQILTVLIAFIGPIPWWLVSLHLVAECKKTFLRFLVYPSVAIAWIAVGYFAFTNQALLFQARFHRSWYLYLFGALIVLAALIIDWQVMRSLGLKKLMCVPELKGSAAPGELVTEGIYRYARHPRYVEYSLWSFGFSLIFGYVFLLWFSLYLFLAFWLTSYFEEAELVRRFGQCYVEYQKKVPRFFIRLRK